MFLTSKLITCFYWRFHFGNEIPTNCLFIDWKCTYPLDYGSLKVKCTQYGFCGQAAFKSSRAMLLNLVFKSLSKERQNVYGGLPGPYPSPLEARRRRFRVLNLGANNFHVWCPVWVGFLFLKTRWNCAQLDLVDLEENISAHVAMKKGEPLINDLKWPSNFEVDRLHPHFLRKNQISGSISFIIHITQYDIISKFVTYMLWPKWSWNKKFQSFFGCPPLKAMFICQTGIANVVWLTSNPHGNNIW
jgi:hypothetical protein